MALLVDTIVPFGPDGHVDIGAARAHLLWLLSHRIDGVALACTEFLHLDRKEKEKLLELAADMSRGRTLLFPIWDSTPGYVARLGKAAAAAGAVALLPPPIHVAVSEDALFEWFASVATHVGGRVLAWHDPRFNNPLGERLLARLAAETTISGWLDGSADLHRLRRQASAWPNAGWVGLDEGYTATELDQLSQVQELAGATCRLANAWPDLVSRAWNRTEPTLFDAMAHRNALVDRAGGVAALKRHLGVGSRLPLIASGNADFDRLPPTGFPR